MWDSNGWLDGGGTEEKGEGGFEPGRVVLLEMGLPLGLATLSEKACRCDFKLNTE